MFDHCDMREYHDVRPYVCLECNADFVLLSGLLQHIASPVSSIELDGLEISKLTHWLSSSL